MGQPRPLFCLITQHYVKYSTNVDFKSIDGVLGIQTQTAGWYEQTNPLSYSALPPGQKKLFDNFPCFRDTYLPT